MILDRDVTVYTLGSSIICGFEHDSIHEMFQMIISLLLLFYILFFSQINSARRAVLETHMHVSTHAYTHKQNAYIGVLSDIPISITYSLHTGYTLP